MNARHALCKKANRLRRIWRRCRELLFEVEESENPEMEMIKRRSQLERLRARGEFLHRIVNPEFGA